MARDPRRPSDPLRYVLVHLVEEFARHAGHADIIREQLDGAAAPARVLTLAGAGANVHPLTTEPWGVRRFFVRAPDGNVFNIAQHRD